MMVTPRLRAGGRCDRTEQRGGDERAKDYFHFVPTVPQ
jgi:hypothetical protein